MATQSGIPSTPRVISPSPTPSDASSSGYFAPITRSATANRRISSNASDAIDEGNEQGSGSDSSADKRARTRSRSPFGPSRKHRKNSTTGAVKKARLERLTPKVEPQTNGHLKPSSAVPASSSYWRDLSRSPSPLGLIPIHRQWRSFVHRHEIPRKALHVSIGFVSLHLYARGTSADTIHPWLLAALVPIASLDYLRHTFPGLNRTYIRVVGALMRESEVDGYNGVIWYLLGAWTVLRFFPKDVGVMSVLLLSWCDTAASTFGRLYGRYTPRIRRGKSLAGSIAAAVVGFITAQLFYGWVVPWYPWSTDCFMFKGTLSLPDAAKAALGASSEQFKVGPWVSTMIVGLWSGLVASASEVIDLFGWDDNATIPILSGIGLWGFFKTFAV